MRPLAQTLTVFVLIFYAAFTVQADIYKWTDNNGKTHYSDAAPAAQKTENVALDNINTFTHVSISDAPDSQELHQPAIKTHAKYVVMFSTARCGYCKQARNYFTESGIAFTEKKIDSDKAAWEEYQQLGATGVPVILIGHKRMDGFSQSTFDKLFYGDKPAS